MLDYNTIFFVECQDGNRFLFYFINFAQTYVIFYSRLTSRNIPFLCFICAVVFNRDHCGESCAPSCNPSPSQKAVKNCCPIYKKRRGHLPNGKIPRRYSFIGCAAACEHSYVLQLSDCIKGISGWSAQGHSY